MKVTVKKEITFASFRKRIFASTVCKCFARFEGKAAFSVETEDPDKVELTISKEAELKINDLIFGASGAFKASKDGIEFSLGTEGFEIALDPFSLHPLSIRLPAIKLPVAGKKFVLEKELPGLGLKGTAELELEFVIDLIPDYKRLVKAVNARNAKVLLQATKNSLYKFAKVTKTVGRIVIKAGRTALYFPFNALGNYIGRNLVMASWTRMATSQVVQLRKLIGTMGKALGVVGLLIEARWGAADVAAGALKAGHDKVVALINEEFAEAYAKTLVTMTKDGLTPPDNFFEETITVKRSASEPPDVMGVMEHLAATGNIKDPAKHGGNWVKEQIAQGFKVREETVAVAEIDWRSWYRESYNLYSLFIYPAQHGNSKQTSGALGALQYALQLIRGAGVIACLHDILGYVAASSIYEDVKTGKGPADIWDDWREVAAFHRSIFGDVETTRHKAYRGLMNLKDLRVSIPPFGDFS